MSEHSDKKYQWEDFSMDKHSVIICEEFDFEYYNMSTWKQITEGARVHVDVRYKRCGKYICNKLPMIMVSNYDPYSQIAKECDKKAFDSRCKVIKAEKFDGDVECYKEPIRYLARLGDSKTYSLEEIKELAETEKTFLKHNKTNVNKLSIIRSNISERPTCRQRPSLRLASQQTNQSNNIQQSDNENSQSNNQEQLQILNDNQESMPPTPLFELNSNEKSPNYSPSSVSSEEQENTNLQIDQADNTIQESDTINRNDEDSGFSLESNNTISTFTKTKKKMPSDYSTKELLEELSKRIEIKQLLNILAKRKLDDDDVIVESSQNHEDKQANKRMNVEENCDLEKPGQLETGSEEESNEIVENPPPS